MIFTTYWFFLFAAVVLPVYWLLPRPGWRLGFLAAACAVFHAHFAGPAGMAPIVVLMIATYLAGLTRNRWVCLGAMILSVAALAFYKYTTFLLADLIAPVRPEVAAEWLARTQPLLPELPPLGVSFFAFEFVHYLYEVRKGGEPIRSPLKFVLFSIFFPSLVAGPIKRYQQFIPALEAGARRVRTEDIAEGVRRVGVGLLKKILIADNLTQYIELTQPDYAALGLGMRWVLVGAIAFRILMDFSGYSDIAIGFARMLGVPLPENFNWPYLATSLQDFWRRWHISLSSWIRDYVYIPLGGSRRGLWIRVENGLIAFGLCGLWHGPAWHFAVWGLYHGAGLAVCAGYRHVPVAGPALSWFFDRAKFVGAPVGWLLTQAYVWIGWLIFFHPVAEAWRITRGLFGS